MTDRQKHDYGIYSASMASRGKKGNVKPKLQSKFVTKIIVYYKMGFFDEIDNNMIKTYQRFQWTVNVKYFSPISRKMVHLTRHI